MKLITRSLGGKCSPLMKHLVQIGGRWVNPRKVVLVEPDDDGDGSVIYLDTSIANLIPGQGTHNSVYDKRSVDEVVAVLHGREVEEKKEDEKYEGTARFAGDIPQSDRNYSLDELKQAIFKGFVIYRGKSTADSPASWSYFKREILPHVLSALPWNPVDETVKNQHTQTTRLEQLQSTMEDKHE